MASHEDNLSYECGKCCITFVNDLELEWHIDTEHDESETMMITLVSQER